MGASCCHEALCLLTGRSVGQGPHLSLGKAGFRPPCSRAADLRGGAAGGWGVPGSLSSLLEFMFLPRGSELGDH